MLAHELAMFGTALDSSSSRIWLEDFPEFVSRVAVSDLSNSSY